MFIFHSIPGYHAALQDGETTCEEAVVHYLEQIAKTKELNAFLSVFADESLQTARSLDAKRRSGEKIGKLHGVIIGIKDVICYKDHPVSASSLMLENFISLYSATAIERLLGEGAIIIGRLNCDEFEFDDHSVRTLIGGLRTNRNRVLQKSVFKT